MADSLLLLSMIVSLANLFLIIFLLWRQQDQRREGERQERLMREELARNREELIQAFHSFSQQADRLREGVEGRLRLLQEDNHRQLEKIRQTVDEQLHATLERRLGQSFQLVSERLEQVQKGLGEMLALAAGVGDLKRVLTNVKTRGIWGEVQLAQVLEQLLTREQYAENIVTKAGSNERVEFAIRLPGRERDNEFIWLPIDAKFPLEDYQRLLEAQERGEAALAQEAGKQLELRLKAEAKAIRDKYLDPPRTTDFALLYLPVEGLYAEVLRRPGLYDCLLREYRVVITGPTTLAALLNSLQLGFRTLAIEKRSAEVWQLLGAVKTEFGKFGDLLEKTQKKLQEASNSIETAARKSRTIERKLKDVEAIPVEETGLLK
ncbi:DNA recombination protein RmuC [Carboxydocella thermautotrophica]|nr:DNA recombination protein RmuC [Carboxydocella thermautotrophica]